MFGQIINCHSYKRSPLSYPPLTTDKNLFLWPPQPPSFIHHFFCIDKGASNLTSHYFLLSSPTTPFTPNPQEPIRCRFAFILLWFPITEFVCGWFSVTKQWGTVVTSPILLILLIRWRVRVGGTFNASSNHDQSIPGHLCTVIRQVDFLFIVTTTTNTRFGNSLLSHPRRLDLTYSLIQMTKAL